MSKKRIITAVAAVIALVIGIILIGANGSANGATREICNTPVLRIAVDTPRSTFVEFYGDKGDRRSFSTRGQMIVVKTETRSWDVCGVDRTYRFVKIGDGVWTLAS